MQLPSTSLIFLSLLSLSSITFARHHGSSAGNRRDVYVRDAYADADPYFYHDDDEFDILSAREAYAYPDAEADEDELLARDADLDDIFHDHERRTKTHYFWENPTKMCKNPDCKTSDGKNHVCAWAGKSSINIPLIGKGDKYECPVCHKSC